MRGRAHLWRGGGDKKFQKNDCYFSLWGKRHQQRPIFMGPIEHSLIGPTTLIKTGEGGIFCGLSKNISAKYPGLILEKKKAEGR